MQKSFWHKFPRTVLLKSLRPEPSEKTELKSQNKTKKDEDQKEIGRTKNF